ncbi:hypothetical protein GF359_02120 [candidate division WOR-3 bacterium]|uniref:PorV/PorQ family protein n=1 Tax=candidate division WOR-3 bacterium TaxID=2052148 RepID=A0A9D5QBZ8_UNCW3|nr:hypothetical protein [candidate division WOR-3 bacterium]MBD3363989.1 hypothetical protein [candidate division WOR-3 bacterium]
MHRSIAILALLLPVFIQAAWTDVGAEFEFYRESPATAALGSCGLSLGQDPAAWGYNPATGADAGTGLLLKHTSAFVQNGTISNDLLGVTYLTRFGALGGLVYRNGAGNIYLTELPDTTRPAGPDNRPFAADTVTASDWAGQAGAVFNIRRLSLGASLKFFYRNLVAAKGFGLGADLGVRYSFDWGLFLGARLANVSASPVFWDTDSVDYLVPRGALGGMQEFTFSNTKLRLYLETEMGFMGIDSLEMTVGPFYLRPRGGLEILIYDVVALRAGRGDYGWTVGAGGAFKGFFADYAYRGHDGGLKGTHLVSLGYLF